MKTVAIPLEEDLGLESRVSQSFGDGRYYLVAELEQDRVKGFHSQAAPEAACEHWNCRARDLLDTLGCDVVITPRLGERARAIFRGADVDVVRGDGATAEEVLRSYLSKGARSAGVNQLCPSGNAGMLTTAAHAGGLDRSTGSVTPPIYQTSTFAFESALEGARRFAGEAEGMIYTRMGNPTVRALEDTVAELERGYAALATSSGMAAVSTLFMTFLGNGLHVVSTDCLYGPSRVVLERDFSRFGVTASFVDTANPEAVAQAMRPETRLVYVETPANPTIKLTDIAACARIAHEGGALLAVDNTFMSPYLQRPLELGADLVLHSMTKFLNGHSDVVAGVLVAKEASEHARLYKTLIYLGGTMDPHQAYLVLRGIKTLPLRMEKAQENARRIAAQLERRAEVQWVRYPGLPSHPQYELARRQMHGPGALISFELKGGVDAGRRLLDSLKVPVLAVSLGGVESLIQHPASMTHAAMSQEERLAAGVTDGLVRLSVGCEDLEDLLADLQRALDGLG